MCPRGPLTKNITQNKIKKYKVQNELIKDYILKEEAKWRVTKIKTEIQKLEKEGGINSNAFWEFKKRVDKKWKQKEKPCGMKNKKGEIVTSRNEIKGVFEEFYTELFKVGEENNEETKMDEIIFNTIKIISEKKDKRIKVNTEEITNNINKMKNKATNDKVLE